MIRLRACLLLIVAATAFAQPSQPARFGPNEGQVLEIDKSAGEITIRHGHLPELGMDPMTMVFNVAEPALLDRVKPGDHVRFKAGLVDGRFAVIAITPFRPKRKESP